MYSLAKKSVTQSTYRYKLLFKTLHMIQTEAYVSIITGWKRSVSIVYNDAL